MSSYCLAPRVGWAPVAGRSLFLDVAADRYLQADGAAHSAMAAWSAGARLSNREQAALSKLVSAGLLVRLETPAPPPLSPTLPVCSLLEEEDRSTTGGPLVSIWRDLLLIRWHLRRGGLGALIEALPSVPATSTGDKDALHQASLQFLRIRRGLPVAPKCLWDSLALLRALSRRGMRPTLVFGAKLDPFAAHCWVQADGVVLNDSVDRTAIFTPLLAV